MSFKKRKLMIEGEEYEKNKLVKTPACKDILLTTDLKRLQRGAMEVTQGVIVMKQKQSFIGYTIAVTDPQEISEAYAKVCAMNTEARHVMGCWTLPGRDRYYLRFL